MKTIATTALLTLTLALHAACSPGSIEGEVDGERVPSFRSSVAYEAKGLSGDDYVAVVAFYTFPNACELISELSEKRADALEDLVAAETQDDVDDALDEVIDFEKDNVPDDYWVAYAIASDDDADDLHKENYEIDEDDEDASAGVVVCHRQGATDDEALDAVVGPEFLRGSVFPDDNSECFNATEGELRMVSFDEGESAMIKAPVELEDDDGDDAGEVVLAGVASWCGDIEDPVEDSLELYLGE